MPLSSMHPLSRATSPSSSCAAHRRAPTDLHTASASVKLYALSLWHSPCTSLLPHTSGSAVRLKTVACHPSWSQVSRGNARTSVLFHAVVQKHCFVCPGAGSLKISLEHWTLIPCGTSRHLQLPGPARPHIMSTAEQQAFPPSYFYASDNYGLSKV